MQENNFVKQAFPGLDSDDGLRQQIQDQAENLHGQHRRRVKTRRMAALTLGVGLLGFGGISFGPKAYAIYRIQAISNSVSDCKTAIMESFSVAPDGTVKPDGKIAFSSGNWRIEGRGTTQVYTNQTLWIYNPTSQRVTKRFKPLGPFGYNPSGFSMGSMVADFDRHKWGTTAKLGTAVVDGRQAETLTIEVPIQSRGIIYADPKTHMPFRMDMESKVDGQWKRNGYSTFRFNEALDNGLFATNFPTGTKVVNVDNVKQEWAQKLEKVMFTLTSPHRTIEVRDLYVNERGHIFVIFTDGYTIEEYNEMGKTMRSGSVPKDYHRPSQFSVKDTSGVTYFLSEQFTPYMNGVGGQPSPSVQLSNGQYLSGAWLVPAKPAAWQPKSLTFSCRIPLNPYEDEFTSTKTIHFDKPEGALLPDWHEACAIGPHTDQDVLKQETQVHMVPDMIPLDPKTGLPKSNVIKRHYGR